ncbi:MAG: sulfite oxidase [Candidatus Eremiobacterota bacterium]
MQRREFLRLSTAAAVAALSGCAGPPTPTPPTPTGQVQAAAPAQLLLRNSRPLCLETPVELLLNAAFNTENQAFFVRSHHPEPTVDPATWKLRVEGLVETPLELNLEQLQKDFEWTEVTAVLQCSGNGRAFYRPRLAGIQWERGAVGNAMWMGARMAQVLQKAGLKKGARFVVLRGLDRPMLPQTPPFVRAIPLEKAQDPDTLLAWLMNGEELPHLHGYPLRAVVPGWVGDDWVKWLASLTVTDQEPDDYFYKTAYRYPVSRVEPGATVAPEKMGAMTEMVVKSLITSDVRPRRTPSGHVVVSGVAWTGGRASIRRVEVSLDGGPWQGTSLSDTPRPYAWTRFVWHWKPDPGRYEIRSRATDSEGNTQPEGPSPWNPSGYQWNSVDRVSLEVT